MVIVEQPEKTDLGLSAHGHNTQLWKGKHFSKHKVDLSVLTGNHVHDTLFSEKSKL